MTAAADAKVQAFGLDALGGGAEHFDQRGAGKAAFFFGQAGADGFSGQAKRNEDGATIFKAAHCLAAVCWDCQGNFNFSHFLVRFWLPDQVVVAGQMEHDLNDGANAEGEGQCADADGAM